MFRKRTKKVGKQNLRRQQVENIEDDDDENDTQTGLSIRKTIKKQKILASLPMTIPGTLSSSTGNNIGNNNSNNNGNIDQSSSNQQQPSSELSVLATKHKDNMEAFIESKIATSNAATANRPTGITERDESKDGIADGETDISEEGLYQQLALEVTNGTIENKTSSNSNSTDIDGPNRGKQKDSGDQEAGALLVGTGIAEVILPATSHRHAAVATSWVRNSNSSSLSSAVPSSERHKHTLPDTTPKPFVKFRKQYTRNTHQDNNHNNKNSQSKEHVTNEQQIQDNANSVRQGFDAFRGNPTSDYSNNNNNERNGQRSHNNKEWSGKNRDDEAYAHFLKTAITGKRMR